MIIWSSSLHSNVRSNIVWPQILNLREVTVSTFEIDVVDQMDKDNAPDSSLLIEAENGQDHSHQQTNGQNNDWELTKYINHESKPG